MNKQRSLKSIPNGPAASGAATIAVMYTVDGKEPSFVRVPLIVPLVPCS